MIDEWFPLSSHVALKGIEPGSLRVRARYSMEKIMPEEEYSEFKEVSSSFSFKSVAHRLHRIALRHPRTYENLCEAPRRS